MKMKTKQLLFVFASFFLSLFSFAQLKFSGIGNPDIRNALEKVIADFPKEFANLYKRGGTKQQSAKHRIRIAAAF